MPHKNIRQLGAHPLLAYTITAARDARVFAAVIVSTDDVHTAEIAQYYGAEVPFLRPIELAGNLSPDIEWVTYTLERLSQQGRTFECFSVLRPTSPFRTAETIRRAWGEFLTEDGVDSLRAVELCRQHPGKMWIVRGKRMTPLLVQPPAEQPWHSRQYQSLPEVHVQNASLEIAWTRVVLQEHTIAGKTLMPFFTTPEEGFDINDAWDWIVAEEMIRRGVSQLPSVARPPYPESVASVSGPSPSGTADGEKTRDG